MNKKNTLIFAIVIIVAAFIVATGTYYAKQNFANNVGGDELIVQEFRISAVTEEDHILGNPDADVVLVEYADFRCAYCIEFHTTLQRLIQDYGKDGEFAWVFRHFPSEDVMGGAPSLSMIAARSSECVADISGEAKFWEFIDAVFLDLTHPFTQEDLRKQAADLGVDTDSYDACVSSEKFDEKIKRHIADGLAIYEHDPNFGTPYNILITKSGTQTEIIGSQPYDLLHRLIEQHSFPNAL